MTAAINVNGRITDKEKAVVSIFDHGFLYGEGVYETLRTYNHRPFLFDRHMARLRQSADMLALNVPFSNNEIAAELKKTMSAASLEHEAYIRILLTRGVGDLTYDPRDTPKPSLVIIVRAGLFKTSGNVIFPSDQLNSYPFLDLNHASPLLINLLIFCNLNAEEHSLLFICNKNCLTTLSGDIVT